ncbi:hypothetical protein BDR03DRAFT_1047942 [Suillus americanus]|nr:hypothetical protein BDR03DRAFT_1047942 [Suillus americanus]
MIILVSLANSLYVPNLLSNAEDVIVDVSTAHQGLNFRVDAARARTAEYLQFNHGFYCVSMRFDREYENHLARLGGTQQVPYENRTAMLYNVV